MPCHISAGRLPAEIQALPNLKRPRNVDEGQDNESFPPKEGKCREIKVLDKAEVGN